MTDPVLDLTPDALQLVRSILQEHVPELEVWAFGSRTRNKAWRYSDLDLAVITDEPLSFERRGALVEALAESDLPFRVDVLDWASTNDEFRQIVSANRIVIQPAVTPSGQGSQSTFGSD
jgi:type I restriction enzyme S subunit